MHNFLPQRLSRNALKLTAAQALREHKDDLDAALEAYTRKRLPDVLALVTLNQVNCCTPCLKSAHTKCLSPTACCRLSAGAVGFSR